MWSSIGQVMVSSFFGQEEVRAIENIEERDRVLNIESNFRIGAHFEVFGSTRKVSI